MITIHTKLTCDHCHKSEDGDVSYSVVAPPGQPASMMPSVLIRYWRSKLFGNKVKIFCGTDCESHYK